MADLMGPLQTAILLLMWELPKQPGAMTVHEVHVVLNEQRAKASLNPLAYTTILTVMRNLARRNFVSQSRGLGRSHIFTVLVSRAEYEKRALRDHLDALFAGNKTKMIEAVEAL